MLTNSAHCYRPLYYWVLKHFLVLLTISELTKYYMHSPE